MPKPTLRLGTRASVLARWQANWVADALAARGFQVDLVPITTEGDTSQQDSIAKIGSPGVFTKALQRALLADEIDLAVHSLKDLPTDAVAGLVLASVPERESPLDVLVSRAGHTLDQLSPGSLIGTDSLRRRAQLLHLRGDLQMRDIRGNVDTRIKKLHAGQYDALVLAHAGLKRLGLDAHVTQILDSQVVLPAVGQGALGIETRTNDDATRDAVALLNHPPSHRAVLAERALLATLSGGCLAPIGAWAHGDSAGQLRLDAVVLSANGAQRITALGSLAPDEPIELGTQVANALLDQGAADLIAQSRHLR